MKTLKQGKYTFELDTNQKGQPTCRTYNNNAKKEYNKLVDNYRFANEEQRTRWLEERIAGIKSHDDRIAKRKAERKAFKSPAKIGDILTSSWGYDQTNIDFYQVIKTTDKSVVIREIYKKLIENDGYGSDMVMPSKDSFKGDEMTKLVKPSYNGIGYYVNINSYAFADVWDGKPERETDAYHGH
jgi:hypothetical protein